MTALPGVGVMFTCFWNFVWDCQQPAFTPRTPLYRVIPLVWTWPVWRISGTGSTDHTVLRLG